MNATAKDAAPSFPHPSQAIAHWLRNYIYYSTLVYVFSLQLINYFGVRIKVIELNLCLLLLVVKVTRVHRGLLWFLLYLILSSVYSVTTGKAAYDVALDECRGTVINVVYYYFFFIMIRGDSDRAFKTYTKFAFWYAVIALPMWAFSIWARTTRLQGLSTEPAQYCMIMMPAYYWYASRFIKTRRSLLEVSVITLTIALSGSSLGYVCVAFGVVLLMGHRKKYLVAAPIIVAAIFAIAYLSSSFVRLRADSLLAVAATGDLQGAELSTYSFISNAIVTGQVLKESPLIGNGLGSHPTSHARFLQSIPGVEYFTGLKLDSLNAFEAGSLTFRVLSEFGLLGFMGVLIFIFYFHIGGTGPRSAISNGLLICFLFKLIRSGEYYQPEQFFFIFIYILNHRKSLQTARLTEFGTIAPTD